MPFPYRNAAGTEITSAASNFGIKHLFQGQLWTQETGLNDYRNRVELPTMGVFLQPDPIGFKGDAANIYRFCGNDPVDRTDPMGLIAEKKFGPLTSFDGGDWVRGSDGLTADDWDHKHDQPAGNISFGLVDVNGGPKNAEKSQGGVRQGDGYSSSPVDAGLQREQDAKKIARGDTEGVVEIGRDKTNPRQFYATVAHDGNKDPSNFKDKVKRDNAPVATSWIDPAHLPKNYELVGGLIAHRLFSTGRAGEDIQRAKDNHWRTFIVTAPERKVPVIYDKYTSPNPSF